MNFPQRGEIYMLDFYSVAGAELRAPHPALILQNNVGNRASQTTIVVGITSSMRAAHLPISVVVDPAESGLDHRSLIDCGQVSTVDKSRLGPLVGRLTPERMRNVEYALSVSLGMAPMSRPRSSTP